MFTLFEPPEEQVEDFLARQRSLPFSYKEVGATRGETPANYPINHHRAQIGGGADCFARAKKAVQNWTMYKLEWTRLFPFDAPVTVGEIVCVIVNHGFCWSINPCRIIYVVDETTGEIERYGFAFGTLPGHSEQGEKRFIVERHLADDSVWYELFAFARPQHILTKIGFPLVGIFQRKFAENSGRAMLEACRAK